MNALKVSALILLVNLLASLGPAQSLYKVEAEKRDGGSRVWEVSKTDKTGGVFSYTEYGSDYEQNPANFLRYKSAAKSAGTFSDQYDDLKRMLVLLRDTVGPNFSPNRLSATAKNMD